MTEDTSLVDPTAAERPDPPEGQNPAPRPLHRLELIGDYPVFDPDIFGMPGTEIDLAGYSPTMELAFITAHIRQPKLCQAFAAPHVGQIPSKVWVPIPGK